MKKISTIILSLSLFSLFNLHAQERYIDEIFTDVNLTSGIEYAVNFEVSTGALVLDTLVFDLYTPEGDEQTNRPVVILWTGGNFLPNPANGSTLGLQTDFANVEIARRLARRGYVVVIPSYRKGWNPFGDLDTRAGTFINAIYRGVQDSRTMVRFLRKSIVEEGNPYGICYDRMVQWGVGSGGYIAANSTTIDSYYDLALNKFERLNINNDLPEYYVSFFASGNPSGTTETLLNQVNHPGYFDDVALCVNMGGALADTSFLDASDPPMICFSTTLDYDVPYGTELLVDPVGQLLFEVSGSYDIINRANELGVNDIFSTVSGDPFSIAAAYTASHPNNPTAPTADEEGLNGLMPFNRPSWINPFNESPYPENAPWDYWDSDYWSTIPHPSCPPTLPVEECNFHTINLIENQDMSIEKANIYLDSVMGYVLPRAYLALNLSESQTCTSTIDAEFKTTDSFDISPNPSLGSIKISLREELKIIELSLYNLNGQKLKSFKNVNSNELTLAREGIPTGVYFVQIATKDSIGTKKVIFN